MTTFKCGGVSLGLANHHTLMDGTSALHFVNSWADMARGLPLKVIPFFDRTLLRARSPPTPRFNHVEFEPSPSLKNSASAVVEPSTVSVFSITTKQLNALKAKINENSGPKFSFYCILAAHIWRCATKARGLEDDQAAKLIMATDGRRRLNPPLPLGYFGNAIFTATPVVQAGNVVSESFLDTFKRIDQLLKGMKDEYLRSAIDYIESLDDIKTLVRGPQTFRSPNMSIISWVWLPIHDADFGWGRPVSMRPANVVHEGKVYIVPSPNNDGSLSVVTRLETSPMKVFEKLLYEFELGARLEYRF